ncbi:hypothetical protein SDC9_209494 [bioreactor metagenome]|uniref:Uncharacterized protein n=1 Tax=bioreactor metagenome TaxID=1076179 RepID=A0A645JEZ7_9ZZZZ
MRALSVQHNQMLTLRVFLQRTINLIDQQHVIHGFTPVTRLSSNLFAIGNVVGHRVAVKPHLTLHRVEIGTKA